MDDTPHRYFRFVDGLRAIAVLSVITYHLDARLLPGGFTGVDVFFVVSGFVVSASMAHFSRPKAFDYLTYFYAKRLRRILPALVVCLVATGVASSLLIPHAWLSDTSSAVGRWAFLGLSNFVLLRTDGDYFSPKVEFNPYTHTWSLGVEEQFYLLFPLLFFAWAFGRRGRVLSMALFAIGLVASLAYATQVSQARPALAFYMLTTRFWELAAGVLLFQVLARTPESASAFPIPRQAATGLAAASLIVLGYGLATARAGHSPWPDAVLPVLGTLGLLAGLYHREAGGPLRRALESAPVRWVGRLSYSLYLWHWPVFVLLRWTSGLESLAEQVVALVLTFALATLSYYYVETPFRRAPIFQRIPRLAVIGGAGVVVLGAMIGHWVIARAQPIVSLSVVARQVDDWYPEGRGRLAWPDCAASGHVERIEDGELRILSRSSCRKSSEAGQLFVIGDSHASAYMGMLIRVTKQTGRDVYVYTSSGCPFASLQPWRDFRNPSCSKFGVSALADVLRRVRPGDVVFLPALRLPRLSDQWASFDIEQVRAEALGDSAANARRDAEQATRDMLRPLADRGVAIVFEAPKPILRSPPYRCADWFSRDNPACRNGLSVERGLIEELRTPVLASFANIASGLPGVSVWDPLPVLCPAAQCRAVEAGHPLYFDGDHLSGYANRKLVPSFIAHLSAVTPATAGRVAGQ